mmetsp:Transcript_13896/g.29657  ORF Transcript_13896/g.29657 Transcript_13896/m.29657 type:complete len:276 (-) Transcript_13896:2012-2839(-)
MCSMMRYCVLCSCCSRNGMYSSRSLRARWVSFNAVYRDATAGSRLHVSASSPAVPLSARCPRSSCTLATVCAYSTRRTSCSQAMSASTASVTVVNKVSTKSLSESAVTFPSHSATSCVDKCMRSGSTATRRLPPAISASTSASTSRPWRTASSAKPTSRLWLSAASMAAASRAHASKSSNSGGSGTSSSSSSGPGESPVELAPAPGGSACNRCRRRPPKKLLTPFAMLFPTFFPTFTTSPPSFAPPLAIFVKSFTSPPAFFRTNMKESYPASRHS